MLSKLYTISLITSLNARLRIVNGRNGDHTDIIDSVSESIRFGSSGGGAHNLRTRQRGVPGVDSGRTDGSMVTVNIEREIWRSDIRTNPSEVCLNSHLLVKWNWPLSPRRARKIVSVALRDWSNTWLEIHGCPSTWGLSLETLCCFPESPPVVPIFGSLWGAWSGMIHINHYVALP